MGKLRVVYVYRGTNSDYMAEFLNAMSKHVSVFTAVPSKDESIVSRLDAEVGVYRFAAPRVLSLRNIGAMYKLIRYINDVKPDIVHLQTGIIWELALKCLIRDVMFVVTVHEPVKPASHQVIDTTSTPQVFLTAALRVADALIVHAPQVRDLIVRRFPRLLRGKPLFCVPLGVISRYGAGEASVVAKGANVLLFGTISAYKGVETLIEAEALIREAIPQVKIIIAGNCLKPGRYERLVADGQHIDLRLKRQDDDETRDLFRWADVLVLPYTGATQSAVVQLGFSFGVPPVVTNVGGLPDVVKNEKNGLVVEPRDPVALAKSVVRLLSDQALRRKTIENIVMCRESIYNWDNIARQVTDIYKTVLNERPHY